MRAANQAIRAFSTQAKKPAHVKRFYKEVSVMEHPMSDDLPKLDKDEPLTINNLQLSHDKYYSVTLDGRVTKTLY
jgi:hypothetical protein